MTGGSGFIGAHLAPELSSRGHHVVSSDLYHSDQVDFVRCDIREFRQVAAVIDQQKPVHVFHLAAEYGRWNGEDYYENLWLTNAFGAKNVIRLQERRKFRLIFFSSAKVHCDHCGIMNEDVMDQTPIKQLNDYAITWWAGELMCLNSATSSGQRPCVSAP